MHLRRALLLFAVVLGLAALAASLSRPARRSDNPAPVTTPLPDLSPVPSGPAMLRFDEGGKHEREALSAGRSAVVTVRVRQPGQVELEGLGLTAAAEPLTPARFDVLASQPGRHDVRFSPASGSPIVIGVLKVTQASR